MSKGVRVWFPVYVGDFFTVTATMTGHEVGAYQLILANLWQAGGKIAADDRQLARLCKATLKEWAGIKEALWPLFEVKDGYLTHVGTASEIVKAEAIAEKKRAAAGARWGHNRDAGAMHMHDVCNAGAMPRACEGEGEGTSPYQEKGYIGGIADYTTGPF